MKADIKVDRARVSDANSMHRLISGRCCLAPYLRYMRVLEITS
jgi:hypothetical protein